MADHPTDARAADLAAKAPGRAGRERSRRALELIRAGDSEAGFRLLFEAYYRPLLRFFARKGAAPADAADLTQETFLGIYRGLKDLRRESRFEPWLYRIATTVHLKRLRSRSAAKRAGIELPHDETMMTHPATRQAASQLGELLADERRDALHRAVAELPDQMRRCLTLRIYRDHSYREIATLLRISIDTVKAHLFQARARLKGHLGARSLELLDGPGGGAT